MDKFNQGLLGMMGQPAFQLGVGLLGRNDRPFGQALGGAMQDLQRNQLAQQAAEAQRQRIEAAKQEQARLAQQQQWAQSQGYAAGMPQWAQQAEFSSRYTQPKDRKIMNGPNGLPRYVDTGELVFPNVAQAPAGPDVTGEGAFRKEFAAQTKDFALQNDAYGRIQASAEDPSAAGDLALIFNYMKLLDPGSTVREGEFANAQNAGGVPSRVRAQWNALKSGEKLDAKQRADFLDRSGRLYNEALSNYEKRRDQYRGIAGQYGYDPKRAVPDYDLYPKYTNSGDGQQLTPEAAARLEELEKKHLGNTAVAPRMSRGQ